LQGPEKNGAAQRAVFRNRRLGPEHERRFLELADRLLRSRNKEEQSRLKEELARMTFGE
jgi:hypothetical protein